MFHFKYKIISNSSIFPCNKVNVTEEKARKPNKNVIWDEFMLNKMEPPGKSPTNYKTIL